MIKRLIFVLGIFPVLCYAPVYWIVTGKSGSKILDRFAKWGGVD